MGRHYGFVVCREASWPETDGGVSQGIRPDSYPVRQHHSLFLSLIQTELCQSTLAPVCKTVRMEVNGQLVPTPGHLWKPGPVGLSCLWAQKESRFVASLLKNISEPTN